MDELITTDGIVSSELQERINDYLEKTGRVLLDIRGQQYSWTVGAKEDEDGSFHLTYRTGRGAFELLSQFRLPRHFVSAIDGEILGRVLFREPMYPGASHHGVEVTTPQALSCLQLLLNACDARIRLRPRYLRLSRSDLLQQLDALARRCEQTTPGPGGMARGMAMMDASRIRKAAESLQENILVSPAEVLNPAAFSGHHVRQEIERLLARRQPSA
jgi:hypothetical protein